MEALTVTIDRDAMTATVEGRTYYLDSDWGIDVYATPDRRGPRVGVFALHGQAFAVERSSTPAARARWEADLRAIVEAWCGPILKSTFAVRAVPTDAPPLVERDWARWRTHLVEYVEGEPVGVVCGRVPVAALTVVVPSDAPTCRLCLRWTACRAVAGAQTVT